MSTNSPHRQSSGPGRTDFARLAAMTEEDIQRQIAENPDTMEFTDEMLDEAEWIKPGELVERAGKRRGNRR
jgi:hypothetical protein